MALPWPHGPVQLSRRVRRGGLIPAVTEAFHPASPHEYAVLLEDDIEVSPLFYAFLKHTVLRHRYADAGAAGNYGLAADLRTDAEPPNGLAGISLYTPRIEEVTAARRQLNFAAVAGGWGAVLFPTPSSWGALYFPEAWQALHKALREDDFQPLPRGIRVNGWSESWKKYMFSLLHHRQWTLLYPAFAGAASFSTNHVEAGVHIGNGSSIEHRQEDYVVPLFKAGDAAKVWRPETLWMPPLNWLAKISLQGEVEWQAAPLLAENALDERLVPVAYRDNNDGGFDGFKGGFDGYKAVAGGNGGGKTTSKRGKKERARWTPPKTAVTAVTVVTAGSGAAVAPELGWKRGTRAWRRSTVQ